MRRRELLIGGAALAACAAVPLPLAAADPAPFDLSACKAAWIRRLRAVARDGQLPVIDIESSCNPEKLDLAALATAMDAAGIALMALSADVPGSLYGKGVTWSHLAHDLMRADPGRFIPTGNGGNHPAWTRNPGRFLDDTERHVAAERYPLMGEFEFRHYPSPRQVERGDWHRDVAIPIDGEHGRRLFDFAEASGVPFQLHYEVEDALLGPLETMLTAHPRAKVIWCHVGQVRYAERTTRYGPAYVAGLLDKHPNLNFDTAFGGPRSFYKPSGQYHARVWGLDGRLRRDWADLFTAYPGRFLAALDLGGDRMGRLPEWAANLRFFLGELPPDARAWVAWKAAWKLLFSEEAEI